MQPLTIRCHNLAKIMGEPKSKNAPFGLTETAKTFLKDEARKNLFQFDDGFSGNRYTVKGNECEWAGVRQSGLMRGRVFEKNTITMQNAWLRGTCDVWDKATRTIVDIKCSFSIGTHPFFDDDAEKKVKEMGYDWQMHAYMFLYDADSADVDFWLFPTPDHLIPAYADPVMYQECVENIPLRHRFATVRIGRDDEKIQRIKEKVEQAHAYYNHITQRYLND